MIAVSGKSKVEWQACDDIKQVSMLDSWLVISAAAVAHPALRCLVSMAMLVVVAVVTNMQDD